jgi:hypothetical protein
VTDDKSGDMISDRGVLGLETVFWQQGLKEVIDTGYTLQGVATLWRHFRRRGWYDAWVVGTGRCFVTVS